MAVNNAIISFSPNVSILANQKPVEFRYATDNMKRCCKPVYGADTTGKLGINFAGMTDVPNNDSGITKLSKVRNFSITSDTGGMYSAASFDLYLGIDGNPYYIPDVWIAASTVMNHFPNVFSNWQGFEWVSTTATTPTPMLAYPVGSNTPVVLGFKWVGAPDFFKGYMEITFLEKGVTSGTTSTLTEINKALALRYELALNDSDMTLAQAFDVRKVLKRKDFPADVVGKATKASFPAMMYITDAKFDESTLRLVKSSTEFVADALLKNDSSQTVTVKTADYAHKITNTHTFTREISSEASTTLGFKYTEGLDLKITDKEGFKESFEYSINFNFKAAEKTVDTWTTVDEKTYTFSGQSVNLPPKSGIRTAQTVSRGYLEGVIKAAVEVEKMYLPVAKFGLGTLQWQLAEVDIDALIAELKLTTIQKTTVQVDGKPVVRYHVDMSYAFSGDVATGMEYTFKDYDAK